MQRIMSLMDDEFEQTIAAMNIRIDTPELNTPPPARLPEKEVVQAKPKTDSRQCAVVELIDTEIAYVNDLRVLVTFYMKPLRRKKLLTEEQIVSLFSNVELLLHVNEELLQNLEECREDPLSLVGAVFLKMADFLKSYNTYSVNHEKAQKLYDKLVKENVEVSDFLEKQRKRPEVKSLGIEAYLIKPIQRLCRYPLLLREVIVNTPADHPDSENLKKAQAKISEVVSAVNNASKLQENLAKILDIQNSIEGFSEDLVTPSRRFIREGNLILSFKAKGKGRKRRCYLFNDLILYAKLRNKSKTLVYGGKFPLEVTRVVDCSDTPDMKNFFELLERSSNASCYLSASTYEEKKEWMRAIKSIIKEYQKKEVREYKPGSRIGRTISDLGIPLDKISPSPPSSGQSSPCNSLRSSPSPRSYLTQSLNMTPLNSSASAVSFAIPSSSPLSISSSSVPNTPVPLSSSTPGLSSANATHSLPRPIQRQGLSPTKRGGSHVHLSHVSSSPNLRSDDKTDKEINRMTIWTTGSVEREGNRSSIFGNVLRSWMEKSKTDEDDTVAKGSPRTETST
eukprot:TRINITY_DN10579_c0_g1_i1.p1 TRINITY_DN10579_c0_g1~~TRINITY_DN10579_c0_g1_i1.p1  ORF type:complete len:565 (+),score=123.64 TRINITY_DN10579_c0_g1_i1:137-1831(+)